MSKSHLFIDTASNEEVDYSSPKSPVVSRAEYIQMLQQQQQVRSIIKFSATGGGASTNTTTTSTDSGHGNTNNNNNNQNGKNNNQRNGNNGGRKGGNSNWKSGEKNNQSNNNQHHNNNQNNNSSRNLWDLNNAQSHQQNGKSAGITSPTSSQSSKDSLSTIWFTPPQSHSPASSSGGDYGMMGTTSTPLKNEQQQQSQNQSHQQMGRMIRSQDLSGCGGREATNIWSSPPPQPAPVSNCRESSKLMERIQSGGGGQWGQQRNNSNSGVGVDAATSSKLPASNACLQLFSDSFLSYLQMIN